MKNDIIKPFIKNNQKQMKGNCGKLGGLVCILVTIGALNWGLVGIGGFMDGQNLNVVNLLLGKWSAIENVVYILVGLAGVYKLAHCFGMCKACKK